MATAAPGWPSTCMEGCCTTVEDTLKIIVLVKHVPDAQFDRHLTGPLLASTAHDLVCQEDDLAALVGPPPGGPTPYAETVARALREARAA